MSDLREAIGIAAGRRAGLRDGNLTEDGRLAAQALGDAALAAIEAAGWQCVPGEAAPDIRAAMRSAEKVPQTVDEAWANMLAAAPKP